MCPFFQDKLRRGEANDGWLHDRPTLQIGEGHCFDERRSGARVPHTETHFADTANGDVGHCCHIAVRLFPLVLQDYVAGTTIARQRNLTIGNRIIQLSRGDEEIMADLDKKIITSSQ